MLRTLAILAVLSIAPLLGLACGGDDSSDASGNTAPTTDADSSNSSDATANDSDSTANDSDSSSDDDQGNGSANAAGSGQATLTIGDDSWTFDGPYCAFGTEETQNDRVSFSSGAFGEVEGHRAQLDASIQDPQEQGRYEGDGVIYSVSLNDVEDFENPVVGWSSISGLAGASDTVFNVDGKHVTVEASFDNELTDDLEGVSGTLDLTCP
jgi:hypothetical protein